MGVLPGVVDGAFPPFAIVDVRPARRHRAAAGSAPVPEVGRTPYRGPVTGVHRAPTLQVVQDQQHADVGLSTTTVMAVAAAGAALIAIFGEPDAFGPVTVVMALLGLVPWALEAGGVRLRPELFLVLSIVPAAVILLVDRNPGGVFPAMLMIVWITRIQVRWWLTTVAITSVAAVIIALAVLERTMHETGAIYFLGGVGVAALAGSMLRRQEVLMARLGEATARQAAHAVVEERTRIAREVHDVVAHSLTVTMLHVTGARRVLASDPARAAEALDRAETIGRESLDSIRQVVGLLRSNDDRGGASAPLPGLDAIHGLVAQYRDAGLRIDGVVELDGAETDAATSLTAFRLVQEALANALQHAPGAPVHLEVAPGDGVLRILAENPAAAPASAASSRRSGLGLRGMAERVRAAGGSMEVGRVDGGLWRVAVSLPLRPVTS